ncbi:MULTISPECIES: Gfo/Idh/MocA family protein [Microbacterium]|uniref:Gfo/Idh/MocA family protein n=1 Tax=Microbacterium TaxID=33882 RepID=UPI00197C532C|nr:MULTISPECIES: Gfo/Idh/MocA family oxidoreductase [Microbacterium]MBN6190922.1 Gfo/Idh/MocA family oxidoreductase [Aneurinibacillus sp. BA2021]MCK2026237.1 Gfo/Idh/MocA family oxidoreductase [Microbacterium sufflavum]
MPENTDTRRVRVGVVGVGKMGLSHLSIVRALHNVELVGVVDATDYLLDVLNKYTGAPTYSTLDKMLDDAAPEAVIIATPNASHAALVRSALERGVHVFCEKPLTLSAAESLELAALAAERGLIAQVGFHNRFIATFQEVKRLLDAGALGRVTHVLAEAYGPVVLKPKGSTWRTKRSTGGGCVYDYAAHPLNLVNWYLGTPERVRGSVLNSIFSADIDDEVYSTLDYPDGLSVQLSVNWSDESFRKMSTSVTISGSQGRIIADRQELRVYLREGATIPAGYRAGWNISYTTDLTEQVAFYLRGEEYSAQLASFVDAIAAGETEARENGFAGAAETDRVIEWILQDSAAAAESAPAPAVVAAAPAAKRGLFGRGRKA